jgi:hypothetical protein
MRSTKVTALGFVVAALLLPLGTQAARAQVNEPLPSYAQPNNEQTIRGRISAINGTYSISVHDDSGYIDSVQLHRGTIINPTGLRLAAGMSVTITGYNAGSVFEANQIDTPYTYGGPLPPRVYYGAGWWYPAYPYGYGPAFGLYFRGGFIYRGYFAHSAPYYYPTYRPYAGHPYVGHPYVNHPRHRG